MRVSTTRPVSTTRQVTTTSPVSMTTRVSTTTTVYTVKPSPSTTTKYTRLVTTSRPPPTRDPWDRDTSYRTRSNPEVLEEIFFRGEGVDDNSGFYQDQDHGEFLEIQWS